MKHTDNKSAVRMSESVLEQGEPKSLNKTNIMKEIAKAIIAVMDEVKGIDKTMTIGEGKNSYKGVPDKEVKRVIGDAMVKHGLCIVPTKITPKIIVDRWEETYNGNTRPKQSITTEATTEYLLIHADSGESLPVSGYGHGVDSQDKGAGKATTYALKYALLYLFMVPTGKIDDTDNTHSDQLSTPEKRVVKPAPNDAQLKKTIDLILSGKTETYDAAIKAFTLTKEQADKLKEAYDFATLPK